MLNVSKHCDHYKNDLISFRGPHFGVSKQTYFQKKSLYLRGPLLSVPNQCGL